MDTIGECLRGCKKFFGVVALPHGFSWDGAEIITLRAIISIHRPDKTLMLWPLLVEVSDSGAGVDLDFGCSSYYVADTGVCQESQGGMIEFPF